MYIYTYFYYIILDLSDLSSVFILMILMAMVKFWADCVNDLHWGMIINPLIGVYTLKITLFKFKIGCMIRLHINPYATF